MTVVGYCSVNRVSLNLCWNKSFCMKVVLKSWQRCSLTCFCWLMFTPQPYLILPLSSLCPSVFTPSISLLSLSLFLLSHSNPFTLPSFLAFQEYIPFLAFFISCFFILVLCPSVLHFSFLYFIHSNSAFLQCTYFGVSLLSGFSFSSFSCWFITLPLLLPCNHTFLLSSSAASLSSLLLWPFLPSPQAAAPPKCRLPYMYYTTYTFSSLPPSRCMFNL